MPTNATQLTPTLPLLTCAAKSAALNCPAGAIFSPVQWVQLPNCLVFDDGSSVFVCDAAKGTLLWTIACAQLVGWGIGQDLYVLDGATITQYDLTALHKYQTPQPANGPYKIPLTGCTFSAPVPYQTPSGLEVFVLCSNGYVLPFPSNLQITPAQAYKGTDIPDTLEIFPLTTTANGFSFQFLSNGKVVTVSGTPWNPNREALATSAAEWLAASRAALGLTQPNASGQFCIPLTTSGFSQTIYAAAQTNFENGSLFLLADPTEAAPRDAAVLVTTDQGSTKCVGGVLSGAPQILSAPCVSVQAGVAYLNVAVTQGASQLLQIYELASASVSYADAAGLFAGQVSGVAAWSSGGSLSAIQPFENAATLMMFAAAAAMFGISISPLQSQLSAAGSSLTTMLEIAGSGGPTVPTALAINDLCQIPLKTMETALAAAGCSAADVVTVLTAYQVSFVDITTFLYVNSYDAAAIVNALHAAGADAVDIMAGFAWNDNFFSSNPWWTYPSSTTPPLPLTPFAQAAGTAMAALYSQEDIAAAPESSSPGAPMSAAAMLKAGWPSLTGAQAYALLVVNFPSEANIGTEFVYNYTQPPGS